MEALAPIASVPFSAAFAGVTCVMEKSLGIRLADGEGVGISPSSFCSSGVNGVDCMTTLEGVGSGVIPETSALRMIQQSQSQRFTGCFFIRKRWTETRYCFRPVVNPLRIAMNSCVECERKEKETKKIEKPFQSHPSEKPHSVRETKNDETSEERGRERRSGNRRMIPSRNKQPYDTTISSSSSWQSTWTRRRLPRTAPAGGTRSTSIPSTPRTPTHSRGSGTPAAAPPQ